MDCQPAFPPTYTELYDNLLGETCGGPSTGSSCHGREGKKAGLVLSDRTEAYDYLLGMIDGRSRVAPAKPECSLLEQRLDSDDPGFVMPPGAKLSAAERCSVRQWIAGGAKRD
jgi:cytochrome c